jgi:hypothetical protein
MNSSPSALKSAIRHGWTLVSRLPKHQASPKPFVHHFGGSIHFLVLRICCAGLTSKAAPASASSSPSFCAVPVGRIGGGAAFLWVQWGEGSALGRVVRQKLAAGWAKAASRAYSISFSCFRTPLTEKRPKTH